MLNYSKAQYDKDRKKMDSGQKKILDDKYEKWEKVSKKCNVSHIVNAPQSLKDQAAKNRVIEKELAIEMKSIKKKPLDQNEN